MKNIVLLFALLGLAGCSTADRIASRNGLGLVVAVDRTVGCAVSFTLKEKTDGQVYVSPALRLYDLERCRYVRIGHVVPVVSKPIAGNYPYILWEDIR